jgi:hypothetical protein
MPRGNQLSRQWRLLQLKPASRRGRRGCPWLRVHQAHDLATCVPPGRGLPHLRQALATAGARCGASRRPSSSASPSSSRWPAGALSGPGAGGARATFRHAVSA